nr:hypothetical protein [Tanacetum cinerariifolium]
MLVTIAQHKFLLSKLCQVFHNNLLVVKILGLHMNLTTVNQRIMTTIMSKILALVLILLVLTNLYTVDHPIFNAHNDYLDSQIQLNSNLAKMKDQMTSITSLCELACQVALKKLDEKQIEEEQAAKAQTWKLPAFYDVDDDEERSDSLDDNIISGLLPFSEITLDEPILSIEEPDNSLNQFEDFFESNEEFSSTDDDSFSFDKIDYVEASPPDSELVSSEVMEIVIPEVGGIKASNDNPIPSYDPINSGTPPNLTLSREIDFFLEVDAFLAVEDESTSSQIPKLYLDPEGDMLLFEAFLNDDHTFDFKTNDDQSCSDEDVLEKIVSKPLSKEEIIPMESLRTHDSSLPISSKIDSLLDEFVGELTLLKSIPPGIDETDCDFEEDIRLIEKLLYDNSSPRPPKEFVFANYDAASESFSPSPILVKDSDSLMEEIDLVCTPDYPMPPSIVDEDYDSERDILIRKDLPSNNSLSFAEQ